jgi:hypothetical protein
VVATGITSYWVQSVMGLIIIAAVVINVLIGEGRFGAVPDQIRRWIVPEHRVSTQPATKPDETKGG